MVLFIAEIGHVELDVDDRSKISRRSSREAKDGRIIALEWSRNRPFSQGIGVAS
jgi:hypothetical protein